MELLVYLLRVSACMAIFYTLYAASLRRLTFFRFNRVYLLLSLALSFVIPVLQFTITKDLATTGEENELLVYASAETSAAASKPVETIEPGVWNYILLYGKDMLWLIYSAVSIILLVIASKRICWLVNYAKRQDGRRVDGMKVMTKREGFTNCSFFHYVFVNIHEMSEEELQTLLAHETVHVREWHSMDKMLLVFLKVFLWFNPVIYLYDRALEEVNEFEADARSSDRMGAGGYAVMLLRMAVPSGNHTPVYHMAEHPVKARIKMLFNQKSNKMKKMMYLSALPICMGLIWLFGVQIVSAQQSETDSIDVPHAVEKLEEPKLDTLEKLVLVEAVSELSDLTVVDTVMKVSMGKANYDGKEQNYSVRLVYDTLRVQLSSPSVVVDNIANNTGCKIIGVSSDDKYTVVSFEHRATSDADWIMLNPEIYIQANTGMQHYRYIKSDNIPLRPERHHFKEEGQTMKFKIYFEKIPDDARYIDVIERAGKDNYFNFYGVQLAASKR